MCLLTRDRSSATTLDIWGWVAVCAPSAPGAVPADEQVSVNTLYLRLTPSRRPDSDRDGRQMAVPCPQAAQPLFKETHVETRRQLGSTALEPGMA